MRQWVRRRLGVRSLSLLLSLVLCGATAGLAGLAYRATTENQNASRQLLNARVKVTRDAVARVLRRNMKDVQTTVLQSVDSIAVAEDPPYTLREISARAFARFLYPESFFVGWPGGVRLFHRSDRFPVWAGERPSDSSYTVLMQRDPTGARVQALLEQARQHLSGRSRFAVFEWNAGTEAYQVVVRRVGAERGDRLRLVGFTVSHSWTRKHYFSEVIRQLASIGASDTEDGRQAAALAVAVVDEKGGPIAATGALEEDTVQEQRFPLLFQDQAMSSTLAPHPPEWRIRVGATPGWDRVSQTAASRTLLLLVTAAIMALVALLATSRAIRARDELAGMKSDFVANVTHELKTPLAVICAASDTIALGRYTSVESVREYSQILSRKARDLTRLIEDLLTYARATDGRAAYAFEPLDAGDLVEDAAGDAWPLLQEKGFEVVLDVPAERLPVRADPTSIRHVLRNLIDNAIKYSGDVRHLTLSVRSDDRNVRIEVADRGRGIPEQDQGRVFGRFERGRDVRVGGSGLGLAIVRRIVTDHGGRVALSSEPGRGTTLAVILPRGA
jgi:signal transduction histidine kinase